MEGEEGATGEQGMSLTPQKLRAYYEMREHAQYPPIPVTDCPMLADAMEIADSCARADIESYCTAVGEGDDFRFWWWDVDSIEKDERESVDQALRYLDARGLVEYRVGEKQHRLVKFKGAA
jgi:hypothetical protein